jgi:hypothetical protein
VGQKLKTHFFVKKQYISRCKKNFIESVSSINFYKNILLQRKIYGFLTQNVLFYFCPDFANHPKSLLFGPKQKMICKQNIEPHLLYEQKNMWKV